ncbi:MAG: hypothetical protein AAGE52_38055 [Myxococcota bacterium]
MRARSPFVAFVLGVAPVFVVIWMSRSTSPASRPAPRVELPERLSWLAIVTGPEPSGTQHSLSRDALEVAAALGDGGAVLFGGGSGAPVQVLDDGRAPTLREQLATFFDPRDRAVIYAEGPAVDGPASAEVVAEAFDVASRDEEPLVLYLGGHGDGGEEPLDSIVPLWGGRALGVPELLEMLGTRPLRLVQTTCFGGGFAEIIFARGNAELGAAEADRCGVFATSWDAESSGCDPSPERSAQHSYTVHLLRALRDPPERADLDGDGAVSLLEAHTHARIVAHSIDLPTTTSERWLFHAVETYGLDGEGVDLDPEVMREEREVVTRLGDALGCADEEAAQRRHAELQLELRRVDEELAEIEEALDDVYFALRIRLLERWPRLDDPWDPSFEETWVRERASIEAVFLHSPEGLGYQEVRAVYERALHRTDALQQRLARVRRLVEAWDTLAFARVVRERGGEAWATFLRLRACERSVLPP